MLRAQKKDISQEEAMGRQKPYLSPYSAAAGAALLGLGAYAAYKTAHLFVTKPVVYGPHVHANWGTGPNFTDYKSPNSGEVYGNDRLDRNVYISEADFGEVKNRRQRRLLNNDEGVYA